VVSAGVVVVAPAEVSVAVVVASAGIVSVVVAGVVVAAVAFSLAGVVSLAARSRDLPPSLDLDLEVPVVPATAAGPAITCQWPST